MRIIITSDYLVRVLQLAISGQKGKNYYDSDSEFYLKITSYVTHSFSSILITLSLIEDNRDSNRN